MIPSAWRRPVVGQVVGHRAVQIECPLLGRHQHGNRHDRLGERGQREQRALVGRARNPLLANAGGVDDAAATAGTSPSPTHVSIMRSDMRHVRGIVFPCMARVETREEQTQAIESPRRSIWTTGSRGACESQGIPSRLGAPPIARILALVGLGLAARA